MLCKKAKQTATRKKMKIEESHWCYSEYGYIYLTERNEQEFNNL